MSPDPDIRPDNDPLASALRGFGPVGLLAAAVILLSSTLSVRGLPVLPAGALLALAWAWRSRTPWGEIGFARPRSWAGTIAAGLFLGIALKLAMKAIVMPLLGAEPRNQAFQFLVGNTALLPMAAWAMLVAGFSEETLFRGYLFERFGSLFGRSAPAKGATVLVTAAWFGLEHYAGQGVAGVQQATIVGLLYGAIVMRTGRVWTVMIAHAAFDLAALAILYWDLEESVARFVFS